MDDWNGSMWHFTKLSKWLGHKDCRHTKIRNDKRDGCNFDDVEDISLDDHCRFD